MSIPNFVAQVSNPFNDLENIKKIVSGYSRGSLYTHLQHQNIEGKVVGIRSVIEEDKYYATIFNTWKKNVVSMTRAEFVSLVADKKIDKDFEKMRNFLKTVGDVKTKKEVFDVLYKNSDRDLLDSLEKYNPFDQSFSWNYCTNRYLDNRRSLRYGIKHRLYLNIDSNKVHKVANELMKKCTEMNLLYEFKFDDSGSRADTFVVYCSDENLLLFVKLLELIRKENKDLQNAFHKPPILTGVYNGWIGYGEEYEKAKSSYSDDRAKMLTEVMDKDFEEWRKGFKGKSVRLGNRTFSDKDYICYEVYKEALDKQRELHDYREANNTKINHGNVSLLSDRNYQNRLYAIIKNYVYSNYENIYSGKPFNPARAEYDDIFGGKTSLFASTVNRVLKNLYSTTLVKSNARLTKLQGLFKGKLKENGLSSRVVISKDGLADMQKHQEVAKTAHKVVGVRKAENKNIYSNMLFVFDKIATTIDINHDLSLAQVTKILKPLFDKFNALKSALDKVPITKFSGSSENYDERMQFYMHHMYTALNRVDVKSYEYFLHNCLAYEKLESKGITK